MASVTYLKVLLIVICVLTASTEAKKKKKKHSSSSSEEKVNKYNPIVIVHPTPSPTAPPSKIIHEVRPAVIGVPFPYPQPQPERPVFRPLPPSPSYDLWDLDSPQWALETRINDPYVKGVVKFREYKDFLLISGQLNGLQEGFHGIHILSNSDISDKCVHLTPSDKSNDKYSDKTMDIAGNIMSDEWGDFKFYSDNPVLAGVGLKSLLNRSFSIDKDRYVAKYFKDTEYPAPPMSCGLITVATYKPKRNNRIYYS